MALSTNLELLGLLAVHLLLTGLPAAAAALAGIALLALRQVASEAPSPTNTLPGRDGENCP